MTTFTKSLALAAALALLGSASAYAGGGCGYGHSRTAGNPEVANQSVKTAETTEQQSSKPEASAVSDATTKTGATPTDEILTAEKSTE